MDRSGMEGESFETKKRAMKGGNSKEAWKKRPFA